MTESVTQLVNGRGRWKFGISWFDMAHFLILKNKLLNFYFFLFLNNVYNRNGAHPFWITLVLGSVWGWDGRVGLRHTRAQETRSRIEHPCSFQEGPHSMRTLLSFPWVTSNIVWFHFWFYNIYFYLLSINEYTCLHNKGNHSNLHLAF